MVRILARRMVPCVTDPVLQRDYNEQTEKRLRGTFTIGLTGTPGRQVRFAAPAKGE
jgi:hypothetical protein